TKSNTKIIMLPLYFKLKKANGIIKINIKKRMWQKKKHFAVPPPPLKAICSNFQSNLSNHRRIYQHNQFHSP
ncbi:hypothetical protein J9B29_26150, partial [Klebsiella pneumoniae]